jgi:hypothetical protein
MTREQMKIPGRRLGLRPPKRAARLFLGDVLTGVIPAHPTGADHFSRITDWGLYHNDEFGVCGPTSVANYYKMISAYLMGTEVSVSDEAVFDLYRRSGNPHFDPATGADDNGVDMQTMLEALLKDQMIGAPSEAVAFAAVDHNNREEIKAAIALFGGLLLGVVLQTSQQSQTNQGQWHYAPSATWGGHAILTAKYDPTPDCVTWAEVVDMTDDFLDHQLQEAWVVITKAHLSDKGFQEGVDLNALAIDYQQLTGRPFPQPEPTPTPPQPVGPDLVADQTLVHGLGRLPYRRVVSQHEVRIMQRLLRNWERARGFTQHAQEVSEED